MTIVESPVPQLFAGQPTQPCPACEGTMPADAVVVGDWRLVPDPIHPRLEREVSMCCPHCDHAEARIERRPIGLGY